MCTIKVLMANFFVFENPSTSIFHFVNIQGMKGFFCWASYRIYARPGVGCSELINPSTIVS